MCLSKGKNIHPKLNPKNITVTKWMLFCQFHSGYLVCFTYLRKEISSKGHKNVSVFVPLHILLN